jgi:putative PEP-CTERM system TPR-repeat lipoprotein
MRAALLALSVAVSLTACGAKTDDPKVSLQKAEAALANSDFAGASIHLKNLLQVKPDDAQARFTLGKLNLYMSDFAGAESELRRAIELGFPAKDANLLILESLAFAGQWQKILDEAAKIKPVDAATDALVASYVGQAKFAMNQTEPAKEQFAKALQGNPNLAVAMVGQLAARFATEKDLAPVKAAIVALAAKYPQSSEVLALAAFNFRTDGNIPAAREALAKAIKIKPYDLQSRTSLIRASIDGGEFVAAKAEVVEFAKVAPKNLVVSYLAGLLEYRQGNYREARENLQRVVGAAPDFSAAVELAAETALRTGELSIAERHAKTLIEKNPQNLAGPRLLATTYLAMNSPEQVLNVLRPLLVAKTLDPAILALAGDAFVRTGDTRRGIEFLDAAAASSGNAVGLNLAAANARIGAGDAAGLQMLETAASRTDSPMMDLSVAGSLANAKKFEKAIVVANRFIAARPKDPAGPSTLGGIFLAQGNTSEATKSYSQALAINSSFMPAIDAMASIDFASGKPDAAKARYTALVAQDPKNVSGYLALANLNARTGGDPQQTLAYFKQARDADPVSNLGALAQAGYLIQTSQGEAAVAVLEPLIQTGNADVSVIDALASAYDVSGSVPKAVVLLEKQLQANPNSASLNSRIGSLRLKLSDFAGALTNFRRAEELQPNSVEPKMLIAGTLFTAGKRSEALAMANSLQSQFPKSPAGAVLAGDFLAAEGKTGEALGLFKKAHELGANPGTAFKLYRGFYLNNNVAEGNAFLRSWWTANPTDVGTMMAASTLLLERKDWKEAAVVLAQVLKVNKDDPGALNNAAIATHRLNEPKAIQLAERAYQLLPNNVAVLDTFGWISVEQGKVDQGLKLIKEAIAKAPNSPEIRLHLAQALDKKGDKAAAQAEVKSLLQGNLPPDIKAEAEKLMK